MHKIISTTGAVIEFTLTAEKVFTIDPVNPIEVSDEDLSALQERLGAQISVVVDDVSVGPTTAEEETITSEPTEATTAEEGSSVEEEIPQV